jgi:drug/metabolite transporter (DMT)-like permease
MKTKEIIKADFLLLMTAFIWGFAFVFQRIGLEFVGPITFVFFRFLISSSVFILLFKFSATKSKKLRDSSNDHYAILLGLIMVIGMIMQQMGLQYTTVARAGFVTSLYIIFVPILGLFLSIKTDLFTWFGVSIALVGFYLLTNISPEEFLLGDILMFISSILWAVHVLIISRIAKKISVIRVMAIQFITVTIMSGVLMILFETWTFSELSGALYSLLFVAIISSCIGFSLQVLAQRKAPPAHSALLLSMEAIFASVGGWFILNQYLTAFEVLGCLLILVGGLTSQAKLFKNN